MVAESAQERGRLAEILGYCAERKIPIERATRPRMEAIHRDNQGVVLEASEYPVTALPDILDLAQGRGELPLILILDTLQDPQNLGTLLRTAEATGAHGVLLPFRRTATVTPAVVSASSGASEHLFIAQANLAQAIGELKQAGVWVVGLEDSAEAKAVQEVDLAGPLALVVGGEGEGMRPLVRDSCDILMRLPMRGKVESLNAAVAGSIALYLAWGARGYR